MKQYKYDYTRNGETKRTNWYESEEQAREAMAKQIGDFHPPGRVAGDIGNSAARNGGLVTLQERAKPEPRAA